MDVMEWKHNWPKYYSIIVQGLPALFLFVLVMQKRPFMLWKFVNDSEVENYVHNLSKFQKSI